MRVSDADVVIVILRLRGAGFDVVRIVQCILDVGIGPVSALAAAWRLEQTAVGWDRPIAWR